MNFQLIDRIDSWERDKRIIARKVVSVTEPLRQPGSPVVAPWFVLEMVCQSATWLFMLSSRFAKRAALLSVDDLACLSEVTPGDEVVIAAEIVSITAEAAIFDGTAEVDGHLVLRSTGVLCALVDADTLEDTDSCRRTARWLLRKEAL